MRPSLPQQVTQPDATGFVKIFHTNSFNVTRLTGGHWGGDLPADVAHSALERVRAQLTSFAWDFNSDTTKILMLTHNVLATEQGYRNLTDVFNNSEAYIKREDSLMEFFVDYLEPICDAFVAKKYGEMFSLLGGRDQLIRSHAEKVKWSRDMDILVRTRLNGSVGDVLDFLKISHKPRLTESIERRQQLLSRQVTDLSEEENEQLTKLLALRGVQYKEVIALRNFILEKTPFATKHGVKGLQFENVLVVVGRGWNRYNFGQFLEWARPNSCPADKREFFERNRNLFYVCCSRAKKRLAILFTQKLSNDAVSTLAEWFGQENITTLGQA